ncbi:hypothetical protein LJR045_002477 [Microbacterium sp. LjRoot45]|uniref:hypothetical protein n=1 Tax=Microbacterium sp. LjRoot45 TaxID=3342329 RepID=UPI003ECE31A7
MKQSRRRPVADIAAFTALAVVALATNLCLSLWTDAVPLMRWLVTVAAGIVAAATTYAIVSRRRRSADS